MRVGSGQDKEHAAVEAGRLVRARLRRYGAANGLNHLGMLTYRGEGCRDPARVGADVGEFFQALRTRLSGDRSARVWMPEWHHAGRGLHVYFTVGRYVPRSLSASAECRGLVHMVIDQVCEAIDAHPERVWTSAEVPGLGRPLAVWVRWR